MKTGKRTRTIHSFLYTVVEKNLEDNFRLEFVMREISSVKPLILIIDEASMVSDMPANNELFLSQNSILHDLFFFLKSSPTGSKIIFVGDRCQLPPVNENNSGALSSPIIKAKYGLSAASFDLTEVVRQEKNSYVLQNAILLRNNISQNRTLAPPLKYKNLYKPELAVQKFCKLFDPKNVSATIFIAWKNATVDMLNNAIRNLLYGNPKEILCEGEQIILSRTYFKNNTYIPSGEIGKVVSFDPSSIERVADSHFANAVFEFPLSNDEKLEVEAKVDLQCFFPETSSNLTEKARKLYADRKRRNKKFRETNNPADDPYLSAMKARYGYAITAHKAQGSEWNYIFLYPESPFDESRLKWIYTAVTRAKNDLFSF
jgi:exodeoxyribonuclease-5